MSSEWRRNLVYEHQPSPNPCLVCGWEQHHQHTLDQVPDSLVYMDLLADYWNKKQTLEGRAELLEFWGMPVWELDREEEAMYVCTVLKALLGMQ